MPFWPDSCPPLQSQNNAFQFDGVDDVISYDPQGGPFAFSSTEAFTLEVIFKTASFKDQILISQAETPTETPFFLAVNAQGNPYSRILNETFVAEETVINPGDCYHLTVVYGPDQLQYYLNGSLVQSFNLPGSLPYVSESNLFYFGKLPGSPTTAFDGIMDEVRIFADARNPDEINTYLFQELTLQNDFRQAAFNFSTQVNNITFESFNNHRYGILGNGTASQRPEWVTGDCVGDAPESVSSFCSPLPACSAANLAPNELLCNGDFEQFCSRLYLSHPMWGGASQFPNWLLPQHAFSKTSTSQAAIGSDVVNWEANSITPDFFVRNGIGSPAGFAPGTSLSPIYQNFPTNTWNGLGDAVVGLSGYNAVSSFWPESVKSNLRSPLSPNTTYQFSGWFYKNDGAPAGVNLNPGFLKLSFSNGTNTLLMDSVQVTDNDLINNNNGWYYGTVQFTTASSLSPGYDKIILQNSGCDGCGESTYIMMDDLSLKDETPQHFPQYIFTDTQNDHHHRRIKVDQNDNVYVLKHIEAHSSTSPTTTTSLGLPPVASHTNQNQKASLIAKYDPNGVLLWSETYPHMILTDFDFDSSGDIVAVGHTEVGGPHNGINYQTWNAPIPYSCTGPHGNFYSGTVDEYDTPSYLIMRANASNGVVNFTHAVDDAATNWALGVHIDNGTAYVLAFRKGVGPCLNMPAAQYRWVPNNFYDEPRILRFDLAQNSEEAVIANYAPHNAQMLKGDGNKLYVLREDTLDKITVHSPSSASVTSKSGIPDNPTYLEPEHNGNYLLVSYKNPGRVERRSTSNLSLNTFFSTSKTPLSMASGPHGSYVMYRQSSSGTSPGMVMGIDKLDPLNFNTPQWHKESSGHQQAFLSHYQSYPYAIPSDMTVMHNATDKLAIIGSFETTGAPWNIAFDSKTLSGSNTGVGNCVVLTLKDNGASAQFKKDPNAGQGDNRDWGQASIDSNEVAIFPNPAAGSISIRAKDRLLDLKLFSTTGKLMLHQKDLTKTRLEIDLSTFSSGMYYFNIQTESGQVQRKIRIE